MALAAVYAASAAHALFRLLEKERSGADLLPTAASEEDEAVLLVDNGSLRVSSASSLRRCAAQLTRRVRSDVSAGVEWRRAEERERGEEESDGIEEEGKQGKRKERGLRVFVCVCVYVCVCAYVCVCMCVSCVAMDNIGCRRTA